VGVGASLSTLISSLATEMGTPSAPALPFLQAVANTFRSTRFALAGGTPTATPSIPVSSPSSQPSASTSKSGGHFVEPIPAVAPSPSNTPARTPTPSASASISTSNTGGTSFADVLASIRQYRSATPEQYATLIALIARQLGVPARLVTGFRVTPPTGSTALPAGTYPVTTAEAWTWVEIPVNGQGWVVLDPAPGTYAGQKPPDTGSSASQSPSSTPSPTALITQASNQGHPPAPSSSIPPAKGISATTIAAIVLIGLAGLAVLLVALLLLRKRLRAHRRRRPGDPRRRLLGAWQESLDVLVESGLPDLTNLTSREVAAATDARFGGESAEQARYIGDAANTAIFSPTSWVGAAEADAAWRAQAVLSKAVRRRLGWRDRIGAGLRYHRTKRIRPQIGPTSWTAAARAKAVAATSPRGKHSVRRGPRRRAH
jgi:hypothetical protein